jgi:hypothetical protein
MLGDAVRGPTPAPTPFRKSEKNTRTTSPGCIVWAGGLTVGSHRLVVLSLGKGPKEGKQDSQNPVPKPVAHHNGWSNWGWSGKDKVGEPRSPFSLKANWGRAGTLRGNIEGLRLRFYVSEPRQRNI